MKGTVTFKVKFKVKNSMDALNRRLDTAEEKISEVAIRFEEITQNHASHGRWLLLLHKCDL